jgi:hypothetical protein
VRCRYDAGSGALQFSSANFWPIDGQLLGNAPGSVHNCHWTYQVILSQLNIVDIGSLHLLLLQCLSTLLDSIALLVHLVLFHWSPTSWSPALANACPP